MGADRRDGTLRRVELVETDELETDDAAVASTPLAPGAAPREARTGRTRRRTVTVLVCVAALAVTFVVSSLWQGWSDRTALLGSTGGVSSLATPPAARWTVTATGPDAWAVGEALVVLHDDGLAAFSPRDGAALWTVGLGAGARCGTTDTDAAPRASGLVCLTGAGNDPVAVAVGEDGTVSSRTALGSDLGQATVVPGGVLRWHRAGGALSVAVQDAGDGSVLWRSTVAPDDVAVEGLCRPQVSGTAAATVEHGLVVVRGCRVSAVFAPDGSRLDDPDEPVTVQVLPAGDGRFLRTTTASSSGAVEVTQLVASDGTVERIVPGRPLVPLATDGTADPTRLLSVPSGVQALDPSGTERWTLSGTVSRVLVVAAGTAVLDLGYVVQGVDLASGRVTWSFARESLGTVDTVAGAFTDGDVATLALSTLDDDGPGRLVTLDLDDGDVLWDEPYAGDPTGLRALGGHLVHVDPVAGRMVVLG
ncbi:PQQ-binding-like beta-propeller repeat protein [Cellulosimicrobium sp. NPDC057127]|uniref:outer membrane protein assembly factor BamB family protein n=1 Tax=Cellulosimicrobium sp. NPDC057127 TaxID=3346026 RepID=UPI0036304B9F